ncbi:YbaY family lipoprotein [Streptomyces sp. NPDC086549]|uniref:YbaY family lipoprotein n=1 Tax=Streptomyces sp. NPDC086549 TaxID=3365752 RepID=UPI0038154D59
MRNVEIAVSLAPGTPVPDGAVTLRAQLEEVTAIDAPARVISVVVTHGVRLTGTTRLTLSVPPPDPHARYTVRVHADLNGSGVITPGDLVSTSSHPVLTQGRPDTADVQLKPA